MRAARVLAAAALLAFVSATSDAAPAKNVLIVRGESPDLPGGSALVQAIEETIRATFPTPVDFYIETIETGRFSIGTYEEGLAGLMADKYADVPIDLVVALSQPAAQFTIRERPMLFPRAPVLFGLVDKTMLDPSAVPAGGSVVYVTVDAAGTVRLAQSLYPAMKRVLVVGGTSRFDRGWLRATRDNLRGIDPSIPVAYDTESSLDDLARRVAALPPDTIVFYVSMTRDGAERSTTPIHALQTLRAASSVPIFGLSNTYVGQGSVGGSVLDFNRHGADLGRQAVRLLFDEVAAPMTTAAVVETDWRELQRFHMPASMLPASAAVLYRDPSIWEQQKGTILTAAAVLLAQTMLIIALVRAASGRRQSESRLIAQLRFEQLLSEFSTAMASADAVTVRSRLEERLDRLAAMFGADYVWRWVPEADPEWQSPALRAAEPAFYTDATQLPKTLERRLRETGHSNCSAVGIPMSADGVCLGAMFWVSRNPETSWDKHLAQMRVVAAVIATVMHRKQVESALEESNDLKGAILDSLPARIAVLDRDGFIISVNAAWSRFAADHDAGEFASASIGINYLRVCSDAASGGAADAKEAVALIERACRGEQTGEQFEYSAQTPAGELWFAMSAEPLRRAEGGAVVAHRDITRRKQDEIALRESEDRFRRLADALPMAIWMSDASGGCTYFNRAWLELTGRRIEQECGDGWLEAVHAADRPSCVDAYANAFQLRRGYSMEYRLRRHDGVYRWFIDTGVPRYGADGAFHGYLGGCLDITERKEAEQMLRTLTHRLMSAQDDERRRIARELHDHLSQQLALLAIDLQQLSAQPPPTVDAFVPSLQEAWRRTTEIASDVHAISHRLHPSKMEALGLVATIRAHCREVSRQSLAVQFHDQDVPPGVVAERALSLFRIVEEALSNVIRHSGAKTAHVALGGTPDGYLLLRIADDGRGFKSPREGGIGLVSMRERVESLDGTLTVSSTPGRGTVVEVRVPAQAQTDRSAGSPATHSARAESA